MLNTWTYPDVYAQSDWIYLGGGRWYSSISDALSFRGIDCDSEQHLINAKFKEGSSESKQQAMQGLIWKEFISCNQMVKCMTVSG